MTSDNTQPKARLTFEEEKDFIYDKTYKCPVCEKDFTNKTVRSSRLRTERVDYDLRPVHSIIDQVKYDIIACPKCGYAALSRYHGTHSNKQLAMIREIISSRIQLPEWSEHICTYEEARIRYQLAIANAVAGKAKASEKAYLCLKSAWLIRGETESLRGTADGTTTRITANENEEKGLLKQALQGFIKARESEHFPIAGMDEKTLDYMLAALYYSQDMLRECARFVGMILVNPYISSTMRQKTQFLKNMLDEKKKKLSASNPAQMVGSST